jgi:mannose-6-phosphate isomerase-like protein (cupin superfamily)
LIEQELGQSFGPPPHVHHNEDEQFYILAEQFTFASGDQTLRAGAGTMVFLPRGVPHRFTVDASPARLLQITTSGGLERFFAELGTPIAESPDGPPDFGRVAALAAEFGVVFM